MGFPLPCLIAEGKMDLKPIDNTEAPCTLKNPEQPLMQRMLQFSVRAYGSFLKWGYPEIILSHHPFDFWRFSGIDHLFMEISI